MNLLINRFMKIYGKDLVLVMLILLIAYGLKFHYSTAGSGQLAWILQPTAWLVELIGQNEFHHSPGEGFVRADNRYVIAPSCAGVNYMITLFCMSGFLAVRNCCSFTSKLGYLVCCLSGSYCLTLLVNALRIKVSIILFSAQLEWGWLTPERLHRLIGVCIYLVSLLILYFLLINFFFRQPGRQFVRAFPSPAICPWYGQCYPAPFFWYILMAVGIPLANNGWQKGGPLFFEHCLTVITMSLVVFVAYFLIQSTRCKQADTTERI